MDTIMNRLLSKQKCLPNRLFVTLFILMISSGCGTGNALIFASYIRRLGSFFEVQNVEFHFFFQINEYFGV